MIILDLGRQLVCRRAPFVGRPPAASRELPLPRGKVAWALAVLVLLTTTKNAYLASISSYFTFYTIGRFGLDVQQAQLMLFLFLGSALGVFMGGPIGDRFGTRFVIWFSILGVIPFALMLPYANLFDGRADGDDRPDSLRPLPTSLSSRRNWCRAASA